MIGNAEYQCSCVQYMVRDYTELIVGLSIAAAFLLFLLILIITLCRRHHSQQPAAGYSDKLWVDEDKHYHTNLPDDVHVSSTRDDGTIATSM